MRTRPVAGAEIKALRARLSRISAPQAPLKFRVRLRSQFVAGTIPAPRPRPWSWPAMALSAASAAAAALLVVWSLDPGPAWELSAVSGTGVARINGRPVSLGSVVALAARLRPGAEVVLPADAQLDLVLPGVAVMQLTGGSRATLPRRPERWSPRLITAALELGELRISTGPQFAGMRLTVVTPEARAVVHGTTLAVLRDQRASCVCVLEGRVTMVGGGGTDTVRAGFRRSLPRDGGPPLLEPIRPMEVMKLTMLRDRGVGR